MNPLIAELRDIYGQMQTCISKLSAPEITNGIEALESSALEVGKAWGHSWLGYQSRVYYAGLVPPPPGANFSSEWGFQELFTMGTTGDWQQFPDGVVEKAIKKRAGNPDMTASKEAAKEATILFEEKRDDALSILRTMKAEGMKGIFFEKLIEEVGAIKLLGAKQFISVVRPSGSLMSRDTTALTQGLWTPPHIAVLAEVMDLKAPKTACESLAKHVRRAYSHLERQEVRIVKREGVGTNVFIGHGHSREWKELKDFVNDRMHLPWDEFNRVPVAGIPNTVRLSTMLDAAAIALLVLTAEDETKAGKMQARMNVIHEAGLFQGRLGFSKAILMLEEGCEEFSNIQGLGQIRFPKNNIRAAFHDVELVLEREGLVEGPDN